MLYTAAVVSSFILKLLPLKESNKKENTNCFYNSINESKQTCLFQMMFA